MKQETTVAQADVYFLKQARWRSLERTENQDIFSTSVKMAVTLSVSKSEYLHKHPGSAVKQFIKIWQSYPEKKCQGTKWIQISWLKNK